MGSGLACLDSYCPKAVRHRTDGLWPGLASAQWPPLDLQTLGRLRSFKTMIPMPTIQEILQRRDTERRSVGRTLINRSALLFFRGRDGVFSCCVRDVTNAGAGVRLEALNVLPVEFDLSFDNFRSARRCRLIWREVDFIGVAFEKP
jgi:hypothetical protein